MALRMQIKEVSGGKKYRDLNAVSECDWDQ